MSLEAFKKAIPVEFSLELGDVGLLAVITAGFVKYFDEYRQKRIALGLADDIGFLINVEQNAFRRNGRSLFKRSGKHFVARYFRAEQFERTRTIDRPVFEDERQHLE